jgi:hypothetical protein
MEEADDEESCRGTGFCARDGMDDVDDEESCRGTTFLPSLLLLLSAAVAVNFSGCCSWDGDRVKEDRMGPRQDADSPFRPMPPPPPPLLLPTATVPALPMVGDNTLGTVMGDMAKDREGPRQEELSNNR